MVLLASKFILIIEEIEGCLIDSVLLPALFN